MNRCKEVLCGAGSRRSHHAFRDVAVNAGSLWGVRCIGLEHFT